MTAISEQNFALQKHPVGQYEKWAFIMHKLHLKATDSLLFVLKNAAKRVECKCVPFSHVVNRLHMGG